jgi:uncharacterized protein (UPF0216 family)
MRSIVVSIGDGCILRSCSLLGRERVVGSGKVNFKIHQERDHLMAFSGDRGLFGDRKILIKAIQTMNQHLPGRRLPLQELLDMERPGIRGKDNAFYVMDRPELERISQSLPRFLWSRLRLPILIEMSPDFGGGSARVQGEAEVEVVSKILGKSRPQERSMIIYLPEVRELRRFLPTTTQYAFISSLGEEK